MGKLRMMSLLLVLCLTAGLLCGICVAGGESEESNGSVLLFTTGLNENISSTSYLATTIKLYANYTRKLAVPLRIKQEQLSILQKPKLCRSSTLVQRR